MLVRSFYLVVLCSKSKLILSLHSIINFLSPILTLSLWSLLSLFLYLYFSLSLFLSFFSLSFSFTLSFSITLSLSLSLLLSFALYLKNSLSFQPLFLCSIIYFQSFHILVTYLNLISLLFCFCFAHFCLSSFLSLFTLNNPFPAFSLSLFHSFSLIAI